MQKSSKLFNGLALLVLVLGLCPTSAIRNSSLRIVGGNPTSVKKVPYLVNIRVNGAFVCGGTLVSPTHVVTAAHCVFNTVPSTVVVSAGTTRLTSRGARSRVSLIAIPSGFRMSTLNKDIALLKLSTPLSGRLMKPIRLCNRSWRRGMMVKVSGWGLLTEDSTRLPDRIQTITIPLLSKRNCRNRYSGIAKLTSSMFCASALGRRDSCSGDSGGPLVYKGRLCGVVSWGVGCARSQYPGVYTSIRQLRGFLRRAMAL